MTRAVEPSRAEVVPNYRNRPAIEKVAILLAMGFQPQKDPHDYDCPALVSSGYRCQCVPPATVWVQPNDVDEFRHETWFDRVEIAKSRDKE